MTISINLVTKMLVAEIKPAEVGELVKVLVESPVEAVQDIVHRLLSLLPGKK